MAETAGLRARLSILKAGVALHKAFDESKHHRHGKGSKGGGQFKSEDEADVAAAAADKGFHAWLGHAPPTDPASMKSTAALYRQFKQGKANPFKPKGEKPKGPIQHILGLFGHHTDDPGSYVDEQGLAKPKLPNHAYPSKGAEEHPHTDDKGNPVFVRRPSHDSKPEAWSDPRAVASVKPGGFVPPQFTGPDWSPPTTSEGWAHVEGQKPELDASLPPLDLKGGYKHAAAGVIVEEPDGRVWITRPTNGFGGYHHTFPKGSTEPGHGLQATAIKEAWEETGMKVEITGVVGDFERDTSIARYYTAKRVGGSPANMGWESQAMRLAPKNLLPRLLNKKVDHEIVDHYLSDREWMGGDGYPVSKGRDRAAQALPDSALFATLFFKARASDEEEALLDAAYRIAILQKSFEEKDHPRWPKGSPLGGQFKKVGADGLSEVPEIGGGTTNPQYQKLAEKLHELAQQGKWTEFNAQLAKLEEHGKKASAKEKLNSHDKWKAKLLQYAQELKKEGDQKATATTLAEKLAGPEKLSSLKMVGAKPGGSNPGGVYVDAQGNKWLVKGNNAKGAYSDAVNTMRAQNEVLAAKLMTAAGAGAPDIKLVDLEGAHGGGTGVAVGWMENVKTIGQGNNSPAAIEAAQKDFAVHAWLANYDAIGMGKDNTAIVNGKAVNVDPGGALLFRAQGALKSEDAAKGMLPHDPIEWESLRHKTAGAPPNPDAWAVYGKMTDSQLKESAMKLTTMTDSKIAELVTAHGPSEGQVKKNLIDGLIARRDAILTKAGLNPVLVVGAKTPPMGDALAPAEGAKPQFSSKYSLSNPAKSTLSAMEAAHAQGDVAALKMQTNMAESHAAVSAPGSTNKTNWNAIVDHGNALQAHLTGAAGTKPGESPPLAPSIPTTSIGPSATLKSIEQAHAAGDMPTVKANAELAAISASATESGAEKRHWQSVADYGNALIAHKQAVTQGDAGATHTAAPEKPEKPEKPAGLAAYGHSPTVDTMEKYHADGNLAGLKAETAEAKDAISSYAPGSATAEKWTMIADYGDKLTAHLEATHTGLKGDGDKDGIANEKYQPHPLPKKPVLDDTHLALPSAYVNAIENIANDTSIPPADKITGIEGMANAAANKINLHAGDTLGQGQWEQTKLYADGMIAHLKSEVPDGSGALHTDTTKPAFLPGGDKFKQHMFDTGISNIDNYASSGDADKLAKVLHATKSGDTLKGLTGVDKQNADAMIAYGEAKWQRMQAAPKAATAAEPKAFGPGNPPTIADFKGHTAEWHLNETKEFAAAHAAGATATLQGHIDTYRSWLNESSGTNPEAVANVKTKLAYAQALKNDLESSGSAPSKLYTKPAWANASTADFYNGVADKMIAAHQAGDMEALWQAGLKQSGANKGKPIYPTKADGSPKTAAAKQMETFHDKLMKDLSAKKEAKTVVGVDMVQQPIPSPPAPGEAKGPSPAMPDFKVHHLPPTNTNAGSHNAKIDEIAQHAANGDAKAILAMKFGTNTYAKKQVAVANDALAAMGVHDILGVPAKVAPGQKANSHPALFGGGTPGVAAAAMANAGAPIKPDVLQPAPVGKIVPKLSGEDMPSIMNFTAHNGGKGLSSKAWVNESNQALQNKMVELAKAGDLKGMKALTYPELNKETGEPTGKVLPVSQHPSKHITTFYHDAITAMNDIANPPAPLKTFNAEAMSSIEALHTAFPPKKLGTLASHVAGNEKVGFWIALGKVSDPQKFTPEQTQDFTPKMIAKGSSEYNAMTPGAKKFVSAIQSGGILNQWQNGKGEYNGASFKEWAKRAHEAATERPAGTKIYRWQNMSESMVKDLDKGGVGIVLQSTAPMPASHSPTATKGFGKHQFVIIHAPGAKSISSFGSGGYSGEKEVSILPNSRFVLLKSEKNAAPGGAGNRYTLLMLPPDPELEKLAKGH